MSMYAATDPKAVTEAIIRRLPCGHGHDRSKNGDERIVRFSFTLTMTKTARRLPMLRGSLSYWKGRDKAAGGR